MGEYQKFVEAYCHKNRHKVMSKDDLRVIVLHLMMMIFFVQTAFNVYVRQGRAIPNAGLYILNIIDTSSARTPAGQNNLPAGGGGGGVKP